METNRGEEEERSQMPGVVLHGAREREREREGEACCGTLHM